MDEYRALYGSRRWRRTSQLIVAAAGGVCQVTPGCPRAAATADHIVPAWELAQLGQLDRFFDPANLRAACRVCNSRRGAIERNRRYRGVPRGRRVRVVSLEAWAAAEDAWWEQVAADRRAAAVQDLLLRVKPPPAIY